MVSIGSYLLVAAVLFGIGAVGVLISRNVIIMFMSIELMLNAANLSLVAFSRALNVMDGHAFVFLTLTVAAAEAAIFRNRHTVNVDRLNILKW